MDPGIRPGNIPRPIREFDIFLVRLIGLGWVGSSLPKLSPEEVARKSNQLILFNREVNMKYSRNDVIPGTYEGLRLGCHN